MFGLPNKFKQILIKHEFIIYQDQNKHDHTFTLAGKDISYKQLELLAKLTEEYKVTCYLYFTKRVKNDKT